MKKSFFVMALCAFVWAYASNAQAAGCYITPTNDYICDENNPGASGHDTQRDTRNNVPGSDDVFQSDDVRSQYGWMAEVLARMGATNSGSGSGDMTVQGNQASGVGTATWSGGECEPGRDAYEQYKEHLRGDEGIRQCSYYDGVGNPNNCDYGRSGAECSGCGGCGGCLTIGIGHLVRSGEPYAPCGTCISPQDVEDLFEADASEKWSHVVSHLQEACLDGEACFALAIGNVLFQGGTNFLRGTFSRRWNQIVNSQYREAAAGWENTQWGGQSLNRVQAWQAAIMELQAREDAGEALGCGNQTP